MSAMALSSCASPVCIRSAAHAHNESSSRKVRCAKKALTMHATAVVAFGRTRQYQCPVEEMICPQLLHIHESREQSIHIAVN